MKIKVNEILPRLMILITGHGRHQVVHGRDFEWSDKCWTHNVFRVWELLFWRRLGKSNNPGDTIRFESAVNIFKDPLTGTVHVHRTFGTCEAFIAHVEGMIRSYVSADAWRKIAEQKNVFQSFRQELIVTTSVLGLVFTVSSISFGITLPLIVGAIAVDTGSGNTGASSSWSHTVSGTNRLMGLCVGNNQGGARGGDYNGTSFTEASSVISDFNMRTTSSYLIAPSTGTNTVSLGAGGANGATISYTGCAQSGQPDATATNSNTSNTTLTVTTTTVADNCWVFLAGGWFSSGSTGISAGTGSTRRGFGFGGNSDYNMGAFDNNAAKTPAGNVAMSVIGDGGGSSQATQGAAFSFAPAPTTTIKTFNGASYATTKTVVGTAIASVKTWNGIA